MKTVLILSFSDLGRDPRVNRQIRFLSQDYRVIAAGTADPKVKGVDFIHIPKVIDRVRILLTSPQLLLHQFERWYWSQENIIRCYQKISHLRPDLILANDIEMLPLALKLADGAKVVFDAHEYAPRQADDLLHWRIFFQKYKIYLCKTYIPCVDSLITVCQGIADTYEKDTGIRPVVMTNAPYFEDLHPNLHDGSKKNIRLVHHGGASSSRKTENMIKVMDYLDERFELDFLLVETSPGYLDRLKNLARNKSNVHFLPPVPMQDLPRFLNQYDIGVYLLEPVNFNFLHSLPNKFFEFIQARLAVAIGPSPEMARLTRQYDLGVVAEDFSPRSLAQCLLCLDYKKIEYYKSQSHKVAHMMSAEQNKKVLLDLVQHLIGE
jgi:hypothetical protein